MKTRHVQYPLYAMTCRGAVCTFEILRSIGTRLVDATVRFSSRCALESVYFPGFAASELRVLPRRNPVRVELNPGSCNATHTSSAT